MTTNHKVGIAFLCGISISLCAAVVDWAINPSSIHLCGYINDQPVKVEIVDSFALKLNKSSVVKLVKCNIDTEISSINPEMVKELTEMLGE